jgi:hypothetical protein
VPGQGTPESSGEVFLGCQIDLACGTHDHGRRVLSDIPAEQAFARHRAGPLPGAVSISSGSTLALPGAGEGNS